MNNSSFLTVKNNSTAYHVFENYLMQTRGSLNYRLRYCWPEVICCICEPNELEWEIKKELGGLSKNVGGHGLPRPPLRIATAYAHFCSVHNVAIAFETVTKCSSHTLLRVFTGFYLSVKTKRHF